MVSCYVVLATIGPSYAPFDPLKVAVGPPLSPPSRLYPLGTDDLGRDILSGILSGARVSFGIAILVGLIAATLGGIGGALAGYFRGWPDAIITRIIDYFLVIPTFLLAMLLIAAFGASLANEIVVIGLLAWPRVARVVRAEYITQSSREYVVAARCIGADDKYILFRVVWPNTTHVLIVSTVVQMASAITLEAGLSFLGMGDPNILSWGLMLNKAQAYIRLAWWYALFPGVAIFLLVLAISVVGDGINDALNPRAN
jgi:peptide/nickel transport system permease protein